MVDEQHEAQPLDRTKIIAEVNTPEPIPTFYGFPSY